MFKAEEEANNMIRLAEQKKETILGQAISDAEAEIAHLRSQYEADFEKKVSQNTNNFTQLDKEVQDTLKVNSKEFEASKGQVVELLLKRIFTVKTEVERNIKKDYKCLFEEHKIIRDN